MTQITRDQLKGMTPEQIVQAKREGRLNALLGMPPADVALLDQATTAPLTRDDIAALARLNRHDLIVAAQHDNRITTKENQ